MDIHDTDDTKLTPKGAAVLIWVLRAIVSGNYTVEEAQRLAHPNQLAETLNQDEDFAMGKAGVIYVSDRAMTNVIHRLK